MRQTRSRTKAQSLPTDVPELEKAIDTFSQKELRELLNLRPTDKTSLSSLRAKSYELLKTNYLITKPKLKSILERQNEILDRRSISPPAFSVPVPTQNSIPLVVPQSQHIPQAHNPQYSSAASYQPPISSYLYQFQQFANNNLQQQAHQQRQPYHQRQQQPQQQQQQQQHHQSQQQHHHHHHHPQQQNHLNNGLMYQSNMNVVPSVAAGNGAVLSHTNGMVGNAFSPAPAVAQNLPVHPDVRLKKLAFFDVMATLLKPSTLLPTSGTQRMQEGTYYFHLTPQQATDIASNRDIRNSNKIEHIIQVQLRFCLLETSCEQEDYFPPNVIVKVNNKLCPLPNPIPTNKPGVEPKRPPRPVNITTNVKLSPTVANNINVSWCTDFNRGFVISAYLVKKLTSTQLLQRMKSKGIKPSDYTRGLIKEKLNEDADCEIATTMLRVSLMCPLGKMRMTTPCRASTCSHLQCFDASLYLQMNERKPTWNCPVCDKPAIYETLVIDGYFQEVLSSSLLSSDSNEIQLLKDGSWATHESQADSQLIDTPRKPTHKVEVISDDIEVIIADDSPKSSIKSQSVNGGNNGSTMATKLNEPSSTTTGDSVDLTLSDSDDDVVTVRRKTNNTNQSNSTNKGQSGTPVITNDTIISLDSPSPPSSPVQTSSGQPDTGNDGYSNINSTSANLGAAFLNTLANPYFNFPDYTGAAQNSVDRLTSSKGN